MSEGNGAHQRWEPTAHAATLKQVELEREICRLRDRLLIAEMKNAIVSDVLHAAEDHVRPATTSLSRVLQIWIAAGRPGLIDE